MDPQKHLRRFKCQCDITVNQSAILLTISSIVARDCFRMVLFTIGNNYCNLKRKWGSISRRTNTTPKPPDISKKRHQIQAQVSTSTYLESPSSDENVVGLEVAQLSNNEGRMAQVKLFLLRGKTRKQDQTYVVRTRSQKEINGTELQFHNTCRNRKIKLSPNNLR